MKLSIEGTPEEIKNVLQAIKGSEEHEETKTNTILTVNTETERYQKKINSLSKLKDVLDRELDAHVTSVSIEKS